MTALKSCGRRSPKPFLADAEKTGFPIDTMSGRELQAAIEQILTAPPDIVAAARAALEGPSR
jgi:hypothetical protein